MKDMMQHKGYYGSVRYSDADELFYGKVEFIRALVSYEGTTAKGLRRAFEEAVDDYLELCRKEGHPPEEPFKGSLNVRIGKELHRRAAIVAKSKGMTLNRFIATALEKVMDETRGAPR